MNLQGIGYAQVVVSFSMTVYYPIVMTWCMYYFYLSFRLENLSLYFIGCMFLVINFEINFIEIKNPQFSTCEPNKQY